SSINVTTGAGMPPQPALRPSPVFPREMLRLTRAARHLPTPPRILGALGFALAFLLATGLWEEGFAQLGHLVQGAAEVFAGFVLPEELLRYEEHSDAKPVAGDVLVVSVTRTDLQAILRRIARQGHSRAIPLTVQQLVLGEATLHQLDGDLVAEEFVRPLLD